MAKTALFVNKQAGGMFSVQDQSATTGNIFFVDSGATYAADELGKGQNPDYPFATIDYAVGQCTANNGDRIYVMPGHAETVTAAGGLDLDVAGISIIGLGNGTDTPTVTLTTADTADVDVDAANITIENIHFKSGFADIAACLDVNATDCTVRKCRFTEAADDQNFKICVLGAAAAASDRLIVEDCYVIQDDAANTHFVSLPGTSKGVIVRRNVIQGDFGTAAIGAAGVVTFGTVVDNVIYNVASDNDACINLLGTGICARNLCGGGAAQANGITATAWVLCENYYAVAAEDLSGILDPIAT
jgi:hypothetical protein